MQNNHQDYIAIETKLEANRWTLLEITTFITNMFFYNIFIEQPYWKYRKVKKNTQWLDELSNTHIVNIIKLGDNSPGSAPRNSINKHHC